MRVYIIERFINNQWRATYAGHIHSKKALTELYKHWQARKGLEGSRKEKYRVVEYIRKDTVNANSNFSSTR